MVIVVDTQSKWFIQIFIKRDWKTAWVKLYSTVNSGCMLGPLYVQQEIVSFAVAITWQIVALVFLNTHFYTELYFKLTQMVFHFMRKYNIRWNWHQRKYRLYSELTTVCNYNSWIQFLTVKQASRATFLGIVKKSPLLYFLFQLNNLFVRSLPYRICSLTVDILE